MASSSSAVATSFSNKGYDVFINFRAADVEKTFASHLYHRLTSHGLRPFLDREELLKGEDISTQIKEAIATASVHVAIFSPTYAQSRWCLDELVLMALSGAVILPVFYNVSPSELRWTKDKDGMYARAFRSHEEKNRYNSAKIEEWRETLFHVSGLSGFDLKACNDDEGKLLEKVVQGVLEVVRKPGPLYVAKYPSSSASPVSTSNSKYRYYVFINHAPELKKTFSSYLYYRLVFDGLQPFQESEMEKGDNLATEIKEAILTASAHVAIFSRTYAESHLCLDKLLLMLESGAPVFPVFYNVKPSELRWTKGKDGIYAQALQNLENERTYDSKPRYDSDTIVKWRDALDTVANMSGFELDAFNGDEGELLEKVVERVLEVLKSALLLSSSNYRYDVFINHAPELKKTFANYLYCSLVFYGLQPFQESQEMEKGDNLATEIKEAILTASFHVAIFSQTYAESHLCLDELFLMFKLKAPVFPVFYNVKPLELQRTEVKDGVYGPALQKHQQKTTYDSHTGEEKPRYSPDTIENWISALDHFSKQTDRLELKKFEGDEAELLDSVVKIVLEKVRKAPSYVVENPNLVVENPNRLDEMVEELENTVLLQRQRGKPQVVGIVGSSGVGKTTLAKELINRKSSSFNRTCLFNVREAVARVPLHFLQIKLFKDLTNMNIQIESVSQGIELFIKDISSIGATAFVILDDIDEVHQLEALLPVQNVLPSKSLILITSRSKDVLTSSGVEESSIYNLTVNEQSSSLAKHQSVLDRKVKGFADAVLLQQQIGNLQIVGFDRQSSSLAKYPSVLDRKVKIFADTVLLQSQSKEPRIVGIVGLAGIGKTRLAREFFNRKSSNYRRSYFFYDVTENAHTSFSLHTLQSKLLRGLTQLDLQVESEDEGIYLFKEHVSPFRSLVILDNVDHCDHLHALLSVLTVLPSSSLILITSRDKDVLKRSGVEDSSIYELEGLNTEDSLELFCTHAFGQPTPRPEFQDLADEFLRTCNGLPLTLKVFGALLWGKTNRSYWKKLLNKFRQILHHDIKEILKLSYDKLNEEEQQIFLHIACSCIGEKRDFAVRLWDGSGLFFFESLEKRCLVEVDSEDCIIMHEHLRDLGRTIADEKGLRRPL